MTATQQGFTALALSLLADARSVESFGWDAERLEFVLQWYDPTRPSEVIGYAFSACGEVLREQRFDGRRNLDGGLVAFGVVLRRAGLKRLFAWATDRAMAEEVERRLAALEF